MEPHMFCTTVVEDGKVYHLFNRRQPRPTRPLNAEELENRRFMAHLRENNPELLNAEIAKFYKSKEVAPIADPETRKKLKAGLSKFTVPSRVSFTPATDISQPTCVTRYEDRIFKSLANAPTDEEDFKIINPVTRLPDEALKAFVIQRYRESPATMLTVATSDKVPGACENAIADLSVPTSGITDAVPGPGASVLKSQREDLGESCKTAVAAFDEVLGASVLKRRHEDLVEASERAVTASANN